MNMLQAVVGLAAIGFLGTLAFALITGRVAWRQQGCCCPGDPAKDARMAAAFQDDGPVPSSR